MGYKGTLKNTNFLDTVKTVIYTSANFITWIEYTSTKRICCVFQIGAANFNEFRYRYLYPIFYHYPISISASNNSILHTLLTL